MRHEVIHPKVDLHAEECLGTILSSCGKPSVFCTEVGGGVSHIAFQAVSADSPPPPKLYLCVRARVRVRAFFFLFFFWSR